MRFLSKGKVLKSDMAVGSCRRNRRSGRSSTRSNYLADLGQRSSGSPSGRPFLLGRVQGQICC